MKIRIVAFLLLCLLLFPAGCAKQSASVDQILLALTEAEIGLPCGQICLSSAPEDHEAYVSDECISALYGNGELPWQLSAIEEYGMFLSSAQHPCEFAVFVCYARSDTDSVAAMCHARLDTLRAHYKNTVYASYVDNACVAVVGRYVLLLISSDVQHALKVARRVI